MMLPNPFTEPDVIVVMGHDIRPEVFWGIIVMAIIGLVCSIGVLASDRSLKKKW